MNDLADRIAAHLHERAAEMHTRGPGLDAIISRGRKRQRNRLLLTAGVSIVVAAIGAAAIVAVTGDRSAGGPTLSPSPAAPFATAELLELTPAEQAGADSPAMAWTVADPSSSLGIDRRYSVSATANPYAISTMPGPGTEGAVAVYRTADGVNWKPAAPESLAPLWLADLRPAGDNAVYGIGTAPGPSLDGTAATTAGDPQLVSAYSTDGGATFTTTLFPLDLALVHQQLGQPAAVDLDLASNPSRSLAVISLISQVAEPRSLLPEGTLADQQVAAITADGIAIYAAPADPATIAPTVCPTGWSLHQGQPRNWGTTETTIAVGNAVLTVPPSAANDPPQWHCEGPDGVIEDDTFVDPQQVHGGMVRVVPFDQLGLAADTQAVLRQSPRVFTSTDGVGWVEAAMPAAATGQAEFVAASSDGFAVVLSRPADTRNPLGTRRSSIWLSDGAGNWSEGVLPIGVSVGSLTSNPGGGYLLTGAAAGHLVVARSGDGLDWSVNSLDSIVDTDPALRFGLEKVATNDASVTLLIDGFADPLLAAGGAELTHGDYTLRIEDTRSTLTLLDLSGLDSSGLDSSGLDSSGLVIDRWDSGVGSTGVLRETGAGYEVVDPDTGVAVTTFGFSEIRDAMLEEVTNDDLERDALASRYLVSSIDGVHWSSTRLDAVSAGLPADGSIWLVNAFATDATVAFTFRSADAAAGAEIATGQPSSIVLVGTLNKQSGG